MITYQVAALQGFVKGHRLHHVKPHGALYNAAAKSLPLALAICRGIKRVDPELPIYGLAGSQLITAAREIGLPYASEVFADRAYQADGTLVPRVKPHAVLHDPQEVAKRAVHMIQDQAVTAITGEHVELQVDTICVHGDNEEALAIVRALRSALKDAAIEIAPLIPTMLDFVTNDRLHKGGRCLCKSTIRMAPLSCRFLMTTNCERLRSVGRS